MGFRRAAAVDGNQTQIVAELRMLGYTVDIVSPLKKLYDLVVTGPKWGAGNAQVRTVRVELKVGNAKLTKGEKEYHEKECWPQTLLIATSTEDVINWFMETS